MLQNDERTKWAGFWSDATSKSARILNEELMVQKWNRCSGNFGKKRDPELMKKRTDMALDFMKEGGFKAEGARVLDIGCGNGALALPLARMGAEVTAFDISSGMLKRIEEDSAKEGLQLKTVEGSWWSADIDELNFRESFDLVIASRTPSIRDAETLERMMACSKGFCYYTGFIKKNENNAYSDICRFILKEEYARNNTGMFFPFMYLYLSGYNPKVNLSFSQQKEQLPWEKAAENTMDFLENGRGFDEDIKEKIRNYYREASENGIYTSDNDTGEGMMLWEPGNRKK